MPLLFINVSCGDSDACLVEIVGNAVAQQQVVTQGGFIILSQESSAYDFLQADFVDGQCVALEYQEATEKCLYHCTRDVTFSEVSKGFHAYLDQVPNWKEAFSWSCEKDEPSKLDAKLVGLFVFIALIVCVIFWLIM